MYVDTCGLVVLHDEIMMAAIEDIICVSLLVSIGLDELRDAALDNALESRLVGVDKVEVISAYIW